MNLREQYGTWGEHPEHPLADWQYEVTNNDTRLGYWEWVEARLIAATPDMLTELRETLHDLNTWDGSPDALEDIRENLRRAIAKATEGQS